MTVLEKLIGAIVLVAGWSGYGAGVLDSDGVSLVSSAAGVDEEGVGEGTAMSVKGVAVVETAALFDVDDAAAAAEDEACGAGPLPATHVATLGPGMAYGFLPLSGAPVLP